MFDVAIVGAGPAGAMLARLIGKQYRVLLVDQRALDVPPVMGRAGKCCGGLLSVNAQQALAEKGISVPESVMTRQQPTDVQVYDADNGIARTYARPYINCHRELFDRWMLSLAPAEVDIRCRCLLHNVCHDKDGITLTLSNERQRYTERARFVVGADGAHSMVRRRLFSRVAAPRQYLAIQGCYELTTHMPDHLTLFDKAVTDFYGWAIPKDDQLLIGAALRIGTDPHEHFQRLLSSFASYGVNLGQQLWREGALINRPMRQQEIYTGAGRVALLGEAAGWISPSSAEGFSYAFRSATALATALNEGVDGAINRYATLTQPLRRVIGHEIFKSYGMFTPWIRACALRAKQQSAEKQSLESFQFEV